MRLVYTSYEVPGVGDVTFVTDRADTGIYAATIRDAWAPSPALRYCIETLRPGDRFVDVGANIGEFTVPIAKRDVQILAIEPLPDNVRLLEVATRRNKIDQAVQAIHGAAGDIRGTSLIAGCSAWGQVVSPESGRQAAEVQAFRLDDVLPEYGFEQPRIVKIDVEGSERAVLRGMSQILAVPSLELVIEANAFTCASNGYPYRALLEDIERLGFNLYLFHEGVLAPRSSTDVQEQCVADYLASRQTLEGTVGSFVCRRLTDDESTTLLEAEIEIGEIHRRHVVESLERAAHTFLSVESALVIEQRLARFSREELAAGDPSKRERIRLAWVVHQYGLEVGGGSETLCRAIAELLAEGVESTVLTTTARNYDPWKSFYAEGVGALNGVQLLRFAADQAPSDELRALYEDAHAHPEDAARGRRWLEALGPRAPGLIKHLHDHVEEYDVVCAMPYVFATTLTALETFSGPKILVPCAHDEPAFGLDVYRQVFDLADAFVFNTDEEASLVEQRFGASGKPSRTIGFPNGPAPATDPDSFRSRLGVEGPYLLCVGRIDVSKGTDLLLDFHERTIGATPDHTLVLVGQQIIDVPARSDVVVAGYLDDQSKASAIAGAAAVVLPSPYESLSIVALEAWAQGIPVLANAESPVLLGQVRRSGGGLWYRDAHDYRTMVTLLLAQPELGRGLGEAGRSWVDETYAPGTVIAAWRSLLSELALGSRAPA